MISTLRPPEKEWTYEVTGQNPSEDRNGRDSFHPLLRPGLLVIRKRSRRLPVQPLHAFRLQFHVPENTADSAAGNMTETGTQGTLQTAVREKSAIQRDMGTLLKNPSVFPPRFSSSLVFSVLKSAVYVCFSGRMKRSQCRNPYKKYASGERFPKSGIRTPSPKESSEPFRVFGLFFFQRGAKPLLPGHRRLRGR